MQSILLTVNQISGLCWPRKRPRRKKFWSRIQKVENEVQPVAWIIPGELDLRWQQRRQSELSQQAGSSGPLPVGSKLLGPLFLVDPGEKRPSEAGLRILMWGPLDLGPHPVTLGWVWKGYLQKMAFGENPLWLSHSLHTYLFRFQNAECWRQEVRDSTVQKYCPVVWACCQLSANFNEFLLSAHCVPGIVQRPWEFTCGQKRSIFLSLLKLQSS